MCAVVCMCVQRFSRASACEEMLNLVIKLLREKECGADASRTSPTADKKTIYLP